MFHTSDKDGKLGLFRDVSPSQGLLQSAILKKPLRWRNVPQQHPLDHDLHFSKVWDVVEQTNIHSCQIVVAQVTASEKEKTQKLKLIPADVVCLK